METQHDGVDRREFVADYTGKVYDSEALEEMKVV